MPFKAEELNGFTRLKGRLKMKTKLLNALTALALLALASCSVSSKLEPEAAQLEFEAPMNVNSREQFHASLNVGNVGAGPYSGEGWLNGEMELCDEEGDLVGRIRATKLWYLEPGEAAWPAEWRGKLAPGAYQLTWGAPGYGAVVVDFTIVEHGGRLYLGEESIQNTSSEAAPDTREYGATERLVELAKVDLMQRLEADLSDVAVQSIQHTEFPDASLGVHEAGKMYAQAVTPGYAIRLVVDGVVYEYHASDKRLIFVSQDTPVPSSYGSVTVGSVQVSANRIAFSGQSTLPEGTCLRTELRADGEPEGWWPVDICVTVQDGAWQIAVPLGSGEAPDELDTQVQYMLRTWQQDDPSIDAVF